MMYPQQFLHTDQTTQPMATPACWYSTMPNYSAACAASMSLVEAASMAHNLLEQGVHCCNEHQFDQALEHLRAALQTYTQAEDEIGMGRSLNGLSAVYLEMQQYEQAIACSQAAVAVLENTTVLEAYALAAYQLGVSHLELHHFSQAEDCLNQALSLYMTLADSINEDHVVLHLGQLYAQNQEYMFALAAYESVIDSLLERPLHESTPELLADVLDLIMQLGEQSNQGDIVAMPYEMVLEQYVTAATPEAISPFFQQLAKFYEARECYGLAATCYAQTPSNE